jgi:hypothetical protein
MFFMHVARRPKTSCKTNLDGHRQQRPLSVGWGSSAATPLRSHRRAPDSAVLQRKAADCENGDFLRIETSGLHHICFRTLKIAFGRA